jgi:hypothetical protein
MGVVYRAREAQTGAGVALKVVTGFGHPDLVARFEREARLAARAEIGEGAVRVFDLGRHKGLPYVAMELIDGQDMKEALDAGMDPARLARIVEAVARTMDRCHRAGVVHRDLKPGNVLLRADDDEPRVADFGLARDLRGDEQQLTKTGQVLGTPAFMAPEQVDEAAHVGPSADIYALGAILYTGLAGQKPWSGPVPQVIRNLLLKEPPWPSSLRPDVPPDLEAICRVAMAKEPQDRYPTALALAEDLARFQRGEDVEARPLGRWASYWRRVRRGDGKARAQLSSVLIVPICLVFGLGKAQLDQARRRVAAGERLVAEHLADLGPALARPPASAQELEQGRAMLADSRLGLELHTRWAGLPGSDWVARGTRAREDLVVLERWLAHRQGEQVELGPGQAAPLSQLVDALILLERGEDRRARRRLEGAGGEWRLEGHVRRLRFLLGLREHEDAEGWQRFLLEDVKQLVVSEDGPAAAAFVWGPLQQVHRDLVLGAAEDPEAIVELEAVLTRVAAPLGFADDGAAALRRPLPDGTTKADWLGESAHAWGRGFEARLRQGESAAQKLLTDLERLLEVTPDVALQECGPLAGALDRALDREIELQIGERDLSGGRLGGEEAQWIVRVGLRLQRLQPQSYQFPVGFQQFVLEWLLFAQGQGPEEVDPVIAAVRCLSMRTLPSGETLVRRLALSPRALERLEDKAQEESQSRAIRFLQAMLAENQLPHRDEPGFLARLDAAIPLLAGALRGLPDEAEALAGLVDQGLLPASSPEVELGPDLSLHYRGEAWLRLVDMVRWRGRAEGRRLTTAQGEALERGAQRALALLNTPGLLYEAYRARGTTLEAVIHDGGRADPAAVVAVWEQAVQQFQRRLEAPAQQASEAFAADWARAGFQETEAFIRSQRKLASALLSQASVDGSDSDRLHARAIDALEQAMVVGEPLSGFDPEEGWELLADQARVLFVMGRLDDAEAALARAMPDGLANGGFCAVAVGLAQARDDLDEARRLCAIGLEHNPRHAMLLRIQEQLQR